MARERDISIVQTTVAVPLVTTAETLILTSAPILFPYDFGTVFVYAWCQLTTGTTTNAIVKRIRRGATLTDPVAGGANAENILGAVGETHQYDQVIAEQVVNRGQAQYSLTMAQAAATANGSVLAATMIVIVI